MSTTELLFFGSEAAVGPVPQPALLRGQFVIETANPFVSMGYPSAKPRKFFMAELDVLWERDQSEAERILDQYVAMGGNHVMTGPVRAEGYKNHYPDTNWFGRAPEFARFYRWLRSKVAVSMVVMTDIGPWYTGASFDWDAIRRDFDPFYRQLRAEGVVFDRVVSQWEQYQFRGVAAPLFRWMRETFPEARRAWHNPPGHLSPGDGSEEERATWDSAVAEGIHEFYFQAHPPDDFDVNVYGRTPLGQMVYDVNDMTRRFRGEHSPWGGPILNEFGEFVPCVYTEGVAHAQYHRGDGDEIGQTWGREAHAQPHALHTLDGLP